MKIVNQSYRKKDAMQLVTGQPVYTDDLVPNDCLLVKVLRSPHANAIIESINTAIAAKVPDIEAIYTWEDVDQDGERCTYAGQTYPEPSPYDRLLLDRHVRFVGDIVAIVAGKTEKAVDKALSLIKVKYQLLDAVLDFRTALDNRRIPGRPTARLVPTISATCVPMRLSRMARLIRFWRNAMLLSTRQLIPRLCSRI